MTMEAMTSGGSEGSDAGGVQETTGVENLLEDLLQFGFLP